MAKGKKAAAFALLTGPPIAVAVASRVAGGASWRVALSCGALSSFAFCDMWYFLRMAKLTVSSALLPAPPRRELFEPSELPGRITLADIDRNAHCNNARFLRECGFGRRDLWERNGVWEIVVGAGGNLIVGAQSVRYRRELTFGEAYTLETRVLCWDDRAFYVEHRFCTQSAGGKFVHAVVVVKNVVLGSLRPARIVEKLLQREVESPAMPADVTAWIQSNNISSKALRAEASKL